VSGVSTPGSRRAVRILAWALALLAAAGVGAFIAAHTNPLQPAVEAATPVASPTPSPSPSASAGPTAERWSGTIITSSGHELHYGGTCSTDWKTRVAFAINAKGNVNGDGEARRTSQGDPCPFATAQPQIERFDLLVGGWREGKHGLVLAITETAHRPAGAATDLGGFSGTVLIEPLHLTMTRGHVRERVVQSTPDRKTGTYRAVSLVQLLCENC
jgi:hypothetical protein